MLFVLENLVIRWDYRNTHEFLLDRVCTGFRMQEIHFNLIETVSLFAKLCFLVNSTYVLNTSYELNMYNSMLYKRMNKGIYE